MRSSIKHSTLLISVLLLVATYLIIRWIPSRSNIDVLENRLVGLPMKIGGFVGKVIPMSKSVADELNTDGYVFRQYADDQGRKISLYIGYYGTKKGGRTGHNPNACYPSQGWAILENRRVRLQVPIGANSKIITVNEMLVRTSAEERIVYHWYQSNRSDVLDSGISANLHRFKNMLLYGRNDGAFVRVSSQVMDNEESTRTMLKSFIRTLFPLLVKNWPREQ